MNLLLTSAGFETPKLQQTFISLINKSPLNTRVIFVPTAAVNADAIAVLPKCLNDLLNIGIPQKNIYVYDMHNNMSLDEINQYDAIYFCGGDTKYLLNRINEIEFGDVLKNFIDNGGVFVGVSAGSIIAASNLPDNLGYVPCPIAVHCDTGSTAGNIDFNNCQLIKLANSQALLVTESACSIIE